MKNLSNANQKNQKIYLTPEQKEVIKTLFHSDPDKIDFIIVGRKRKNGSFDHPFWIRTDELAYNLRWIYLPQGCDLYITSQSFTAKGKEIGRKKQYIFSIQNVVIDIDIHDNPSFDKIKEAETIIMNYLSSINFPKPNVINWTGRGIQLWWHLTRNKPCMAFLWNKLVRYMCLIFNSVLLKNKAKAQVDEAASKKINGIFRLPNSYNSNTNTYAIATLIHDDEFTIQELIDIIEPIAIRIYCDKIAAKNNCTYCIAPQNKATTCLNKKRMEFITESIKSENRPVNDELRHNRLLLYYNAAKQVYGADEALNKTNQINSMLFKEPLPQNEINYMINYINTNYNYLKFHNDTFITFGQFEKKWITREEERANKKQKAKREKEERNKKIIELCKQGKKQKEIAKLLHIDRTTVYRVIRKRT